MRLGVLFSGGKDSCYAMYSVMKEHEIACLITVRSKNPESYMFHTPNIELAELQAEAIGLPIIVADTKGEKEKELDDLKKAIKRTKELFKIEGIVTGALASEYQKSRIERICRALNLVCINPLWEKNQIQLLNEIFYSSFEVIITGIFAEPLGEKWLGRKLDRDMIAELAVLQEKFKINPAGEGGEIETFVVYAPFFKKRIVVKEADKIFLGYSGVYKIKRADLE